MFVVHNIFVEAFLTNGKKNIIYIYIYICMLDLGLGDVSNFIDSFEFNVLPQ